MCAGGDVENSPGRRDESSPAQYKGEARKGLRSRVRKGLEKLNTIKPRRKCVNLKERPYGVADLRMILNYFTFLYDEYNPVIQHPS